MQIVIAKTHTLNVDDGAMAPHVRDFVFEYGMRQLLNDAGSAAKGADDKLAFAQKKLDALMRGEVRTARTAVDEVTAEARRIAERKIKDALRAQGRKIGDVDKEKMRDAVDRLAATDEVREAAEEAVAAKGAVTSDGVDLGGLGL